MKKTIGVILAFIIFLAACIYVVISSPKQRITYVKFVSNTSFILGIDNQDRVNIYNALDDNRLFSITSFNKKHLGDASQIIKNKLTDKEVTITVMTMNSENKNRIVKIITDNMPGFTINTSMPTEEEMITYSEEVKYDVKDIYNRNELSAIAKDINDEIELYVTEELSKLEEINQDNIDDIKFDNYELNIEHFKEQIRDNIDFNYEVVFAFNDDVLTHSIRFIIIISYDNKEKKVYDVYSLTYDDNQVKDYHEVYYDYG